EIAALVGLSAALVSRGTRQVKRRADDEDLTWRDFREWAATIGLVLPAHVRRDTATTLGLGPGCEPETVPSVPDGVIVAASDLAGDPGKDSDGYEERATTLSELRKEFKQYRKIAKRKLDRPNSQPKKHLHITMR
ncbi:unnamed protein product, partial [Prorocentrum cordatum]